MLKINGNSQRYHSRIAMLVRIPYRRDINWFSWRWRYPLSRPRLVVTGPRICIRVLFTHGGRHLANKDDARSVCNATTQSPAALLRKFYSRQDDGYPSSESIDQHQTGDADRMASERRGWPRTWWPRVCSTLVLLRDGLRLEGPSAALGDVRRLLSSVIGWRKYVRAWLCLSGGWGVGCLSVCMCACVCACVCVNVRRQICYAANS